MAEFIFTPATIHDPMNHPRRIYFSCHADDLQHFDAVAEQIRAINADCVIAHAAAGGDEALRLGQLEDFHLTVIPITENWFLDGPHAREFARLTTCNKAILPIVFDAGLSERFSKTTNKLQYLRINDPAFSEKLRRTLRDILFDSRLLEQVNSVFTHKMFVSYCREDADQAMRLIRSIHSIESGKRIAIWYDKYLPMGKNFENSIFTELDDSNFLAMTLTPNLLNRDNYAKKYEYRHAQTHEKQIIFFELSPVDRAKLLGQLERAEEYAYISLDSPKDFAAFVQQLVTNTPGKAQKDAPPLDEKQISYLLGLAYQNGLFVEFDHPYAAQKFKEAANAQHADAAHALANMFYHGSGIPRDVEKAISWYKKEVRITEKLFVFCVKQLCRIKEVPMIVYNPMTKQLEGPSDKQIDGLQAIVDAVCNVAEDLIACCCNNARILRDEGRLNGAEKLYRIALNNLDLIDSVANRLALGAKHRNAVENEMNRLLLLNNRADTDSLQSSWLTCTEEYTQNPNAAHRLRNLLLSADNYGTMLMQDRQATLARQVMLEALGEIEKNPQEPSSQDYTVIHGLELILRRHIGLSYILEKPESEQARAFNGQQAIAMLQSALTAAQDTTFDFEADPYLYTKQPQILLHIGDAYNYMHDNSNAYDYYLKALSQMLDSEKALGSRVDTLDFPIILLQFYAQCLPKIARYRDLKNVHRLCLIAEWLIHRFEKIEFVGEHIQSAREYLQELKDTLAFWKSVSDDDSTV